MGVPAADAAEQGVLSSLHQVDGPREGHLQTDGLKGCVTSVGAAEEQARHELRNDGTSAQVPHASIKGFYSSFI